MNGAKKIPNYALVLILFVVAALIFTFYVTLPYKQKKPNADFEHLQAEQTIKKYEEHYARLQDFKEEMQKLRAQWQELQKATTVTQSSFSTDLTYMNSLLNIEIESVNVPEENIHRESITSSNMVLCDIPMQIRYTMSRDKMISMFKYLESESKGRYNFTNVSLRVIDKETVEGRYVYYKGDYQVSFSGNLYYFKSLA